MTNEERFKSAIERRAEYIKYRDLCKKRKVYSLDEFDWLALQHKEELKPCPFCGCDPTLHEEHHFSFVKCRKCGARTFHGGSVQEVVEAWNRRVK